MKPLPVRTPVFVDSSGHRHRRIRRLGMLIAVPVVGYLVLLASSVLGGPSVNTPLIPLPEAAKQQPAPRVTPTLEPTDKPTRTPEPTVQPVNEVKNTTTPSATPTTPSTRPTTTPTPSTTPTTTVTPGPPIKTTHGKPTTPPGRTKSPSKP